MKSNSIASFAEEILRNRHYPIHYCELTRLILRKHPLSGKTPEMTVNSVLATDSRFKRVAEGVYALATWEEYPAVRFAKDIGYDILKSRRRPMFAKELGEEIFKERQFKNPPAAVARGFARIDSRYYYDRETNLIGLSAWKKS